MGAGDGTGFSVWRSAAVLSNHLVEVADKLPAPPHVELGSGLGLTGLTMAKILVERGAEVPAVYCTDGCPEALALVRQAAAINEVEGVVKTATLEWGRRDQVELLLDELGQPPGLVIAARTSFTTSMRSPRSSRQSRNSGRSSRSLLLRPATQRGSSAPVRWSTARAARTSTRASGAVENGTASCSMRRDTA